MVSMSFLASFGVLFTKAPLVVTSILLLSSYKALHKNIELKIDKKKSPMTWKTGTNTVNLSQYSYHVSPKN